MFGEVIKILQEYKKCVINGEEYTSLYSRSQRSCAIAAKWRGVIRIDPCGEAPICVGHVISFILHDIDVSLNLHQCVPNILNSIFCSYTVVW